MTADPISFVRVLKRLKSTFSSPWDLLKRERMNASNVIATEGQKFHKIRLLSA
jgi:hypothetical protein